MRYWWVSQNQTFEHEVPGGYLWSPKVKKDGALNHYYETMREVSRGDLIFSFCEMKIKAIGFARGPAFTCPKPAEFGSAGMNWNRVGWRVDVSFQKLRHTIIPREHMDLLRPLLQYPYAPIRPDGVGNQMYLTEISKLFGQALIGLIGTEVEQFLAERAFIVSPDVPDDIEDTEANELLKNWDKVQVEDIKKSNLPETEKEQVIQSRRGQGLFRNRLKHLETHCRVTGVDDFDHLIASHIKPWKVSNNSERLDGENGLLLTPSIDHLFDRGYISFRNEGELLISPTTNRLTLKKMGIPENHFNAGGFTQIQVKYLEFHRDEIFLKSRA